MAPVLPDLPAAEAAVIEMTNTYRRQNKLAEVRPDAMLTKAARTYAAYLAKADVFSHTADGRQAGDRVTSAGYAWCSVAENLALHLDSRGFESRDLARKSVEGWINSPSHKANLLSPQVTEIGVGIARAPGKDPKFLSVQLFARPKSLEMKFQIANGTSVPVTYGFDGERTEIEPRMAITHTSCQPGTISLEKAGTKTVRGRYEAQDGKVYKLEPDAELGVRVEIGERERIE